jgi:hypothetical protein
MYPDYTMDLSYLWAGIAISFVVMAVLVRRRAPAAAAEPDLQAWADRHGWRLIRPRPRFWTRWPAPGTTTAVLSGELGGRPVTMTEFELPGSKGHSFHRVQLVVRLRRSWTSVEVSRRGAAQRIEEVVRNSPAAATGQAAFDRAYLVVAEDPTTVPALIGPRLVDEHLQGLLPDWSVLGDHLMAYHDVPIGDPDTIARRFGPLLRIADLIDPR